MLIEGMGPMREQWVPLLIVLSVLTMGLGNLVAIAQRSVKRMLAYSSIAHTGYILVGIASFQAATEGEIAISSVLFYNFAYTFMNLGAFAIVAWLQSKPIWFRLYRSGYGPSSAAMMMMGRSASGTPRSFATRPRMRSLV